MYKRMKLEHLLTQHIKITSKQIKIPKCEARICKSLRKKQAEHSLMYESKMLFDLHPRVREIKTKINKWDLTKLKSFAQQRKP